MVSSFQQDQIEFAQDVRTTCHQLNNFLTILQCQHDFMKDLPSEKIESELAAILKELDPLVEETTSQVLELSKKSREVLALTDNNKGRM